jgi:sugar lactone lactonase YvrE
MKNYRRSVVAVAAIGLLAGCAQTASSPVVPVSGSTQMAPLFKAVPGEAQNAKAGRVLYIADIDGQPGVGQIHVYTANMQNPQQIRTITNGTGRPFGLWVDHKNILYAANETNKYPASVTEFKPGASSPFFRITNFKGEPQSVAVDSHQNVFVNESYSDQGWVQEFTPGSNTAKMTIDTGIAGYAFTPGSMAFDPSGNLIVAEQAKLALHIVKIAPESGAVTPLNLDLTNITGPGMGIDKAGNIYVASSGGSAIAVFPPGQAEPSRTISPVGAYGLTWVTSDGAVYQASGESTVTGIAAGSNSPTFTLTCQCSAQGVAVSR